MSVRRQGGGGSTTLSSRGSSFTFSADEQAGMNKDLAEIARRLSELSGIGESDTSFSTAGPPKVLIVPSSSVNSPFVSGLRGKTSTGTMVGDSGDSGSDRLEDGWGAAEQKLKLLETVLQRLAELDRLVLKKTAPESAPGSTVVAARRSSRGFDLLSLPTHLHLVDRLLDIHVQSKRVTVIRTNTTSDAGKGAFIPPPEPAPATAFCATTAAFPIAQPPASPRGKTTTTTTTSEKTANERLILEVTRLGKQLEESTEQRKAVMEDCSSARRDANTAKKEIELLKKQLDECESKHGDEIARMKQLLSSERDMVRSSSEQLEVQVSSMQALVSAVTERCHRAIIINNNNSSSSSSSSKPSGATTAPMPAEAHSCLETLENALSSLGPASQAQEASLRDQLESVLAVKDALESDLYSQQTRSELLQRDLETTSRELDALKGAYSALEMETAQAQSKQQQLQQAKLSETAITDLTADLAKAHRRIFDLEKVASAVVDIENRYRLAEEAKSSLQRQLTEALLERDESVQLCETLKIKMRELSMRSGGKEKDFLDSYEEVMRDEMMTMKEAFERKLRAAKDEADANSRRNAELIKSLSTEKLGFSTASRR